MTHIESEQGSSVSVIIPAYNSHLTLGQSIDALIKQTAYKHIDNIIIVDSSDDEIALEQLEMLRKTEKVVVHTSGIRVMPARQRNIGAKHAKSELLCFLDSDAYPSPDWIEKILEANASGVRVGGGSYRLPPFQEDMIIPRAQYFLEFNEFFDVGKPRKKLMLPSCNLFCERILFQEIGGFPELRASEDTLFGLLANQKAPLMFFPDISIYHIFREHSDHYYNNQSLIGMYIFIYRKYIYDSVYYRGILPYILLPGFIFIKLVRIVARILKSGKMRMKYFFPTSGQFLAGLFYWSKGFWKGIGKYKDIASSFEQNKQLSPSAIECYRNLARQFLSRSKN